MARLSPDELRSRLKLDYIVCRRMFGEVFSGEAYRTTSDLQRLKDPIMSPDDGHYARKYRIDFHVKTLIGPGRLTDLTTIGLDLEAGNYPYEEPRIWIISSHIPYSPHFKKNAVCTGDIWERSEGRMLLGELLVHIARLLNWDVRSRGYEGWNGIK